MLKVNLIAPLKLAHYLNQFGNLDLVVNILSSADLYPLPHFAGYGASKRALRYWAETISKETRGVRILAVVPGAMETNLQANNPASSKLFVMNPNNVARKIINLISQEAQGEIYIGFRSRVSLGISKIPIRKLRNLIVKKLF